MYSVSIKEMIKEFDLTTLTPNIDNSGRVITNFDINRPALQLAGFFDYFDSDRIQIIGLIEYTYLQKIDVEQRKKVLKKIFEYKVPCLVICRNLKPLDEMLEYANEYNVPVLQSEYSTSDFMGEVIKWLKVQLAPRATVHGVFVDIFGEGVLIMGESGIGKSETAIELIKRGHRLVADDAVEIKRVSKETLIGTSPEIIRYFIELRGIGIIDVKNMFGVGSVKATQSIDLVIKLEHWDENKEYDRLGLTQEFTTLLGNNVVCHSIPIRPGRNIAIICEAAAVNHRQKKMGYNAAETLSERIMQNINKEQNEELGG